MNGGRIPHRIGHDFRASSVILGFLGLAELVSGCGGLQDSIRILSFQQLTNSVHSLQASERTAIGGNSRVEKRQITGVEITREVTQAVIIAGSPITERTLTIAFVRSARRSLSHVRSIIFLSKATAIRPDKRDLV